MRTKAAEEKEEKAPKNAFAPPSNDRTPAERRQQLKALINKVNNDNKYTVMATADEVVNPYFLRRPSGIMQLDIDTGGGLPAGGVSMLTGPDNAGKSFLLYKYFAQHQRLYGASSILGLAPVEGAPDYFFMRKCGVQIAIPDAMVEERNEQRKLRGLPGFNKEEKAFFKRQVGEVVILAGQTGEDLLDAVLDSIRKNLFGIIGIDSLTALMPSQVAQQTSLHENGQRASNATLATHFFQRLYPFLIGMWGRNDTTILCTQQVRANPAKATAVGPMAKFVKDWAPAGAYAAKHGKMIDLLVWNGEKVRAKSAKQGESGEVLGKWINWETVKGKGGTHDNVRGDVEFRYDTLTNDLMDLVTTGIRYKAIVETDGYLSLVQHTTGELLENFKKLAGPERFVEKLAESAENEFLVRREVLAHAGIECAYQ